MFKKSVQALASLLFVLFFVSVLCFTLMAAGGADAAEIKLRLVGAPVTKESLAAMRETLGLTDSLPLQYLRWAGGLLRGDLGISVRTGNPIGPELVRFLQPTLRLMGLSVLWTLVITLSLGVLAARFRGRSQDHAVQGFSLLGICLPPFWLGFLLLLFFAVRLGWFKVLPEPGLKGLILPSLSVALPVSAALVRVFRAALIAEKHTDYARYARARGLSESRVIICHALRNAMPPFLSLLCQQTGYLLTGTVIIEAVFSMKGLGSYLIGAVMAADMSAVATVVMLVAAAFVVLNFLGDKAGQKLCPWMKKEAEK